METSSMEIDKRLLRATKRLNTLMLAGVMGVLFGTALFVITLLSLHRGLPYPGHYLNLLGVFLPGYSVSPAGAWIGLFWGGVMGAVCGAVVYRVYARDLPDLALRFMEQSRNKNKPGKIVLRLSGHALGLAMGVLVAAGLLLSTNWLVVQGTASESVHAALLSNYLPGYTVSLKGSLIGAGQLFLVVYAACFVLSWIYNLVVKIRT